MKDCLLFQLIFVTHAYPTSAAVLTVSHNIGVASSDSLTDSDLQLLKETEQDRTRQNKTFIYTIILLEPFYCTKAFCATFLYLNFEIFWQKNISTKAALKMLMKLTTE